MKRLLLFLLSLSLLLSFSACGRERESAPSPTPAPVEETAPAVKEPAGFDNSGAELLGSAIGSLACDTPYRAVYSEVWEVPEGKSVERRFYLYTNGLRLWDNFLVILKSRPDDPPVGESGEDEYAVFRADHFGAGTGYKTAVAESDWDWDSFCSDLNGALIELSIADRGKTAEIVMTATTADGKEYHQSYKEIAADGPLYFCLSVENACIDLLDAESE